MQRKPYRRLSWFALGALLLFVTAILLLPLGVKYGLEKWLLDSGADYASVENVDLNLFSGVLVIENAETRSEDHEPLRIDRLLVEMDWLPLFKKRILIPRINLSGLQLPLQRIEERILIGGIDFAAALPPAEEAKPEEASAAGPWGVGLTDLEIKNSQVSYQEADFSSTLSVEYFSLVQLFSWTPGQSSDFDVRMQLNQSPVNIAGNTKPFSDDIELNTRLSVDHFSLAPLNHFLAGAGVADLHGKLSIDSDIQLMLSPQGKIKFSFGGELATEALAVAVEQMMIKQEKLVWTGNVEVALVEDVTPAMTLKGAIDSAGLQVTDQAREIILLQIASVNGKEITMNGLNVIRVGRLTGDKLEFMILPDKQLGSLLQLEMDAIHLDSLHQLNIDRIGLNGLNLALVRQADGIDILELFTEKDTVSVKQKAPLTASESDPAPQPAAAGQPAFVIKINETGLAGENRISFQDQAVEPPYMAVVEPLTLAIRGIDSGDAARLSQIQLQGKVNKHTDFSLKGDMTLLSEKPTGQGNAKISALDLQPLSSYVAPVLGFELKHGQLYADTRFSVTAGEFDISNKLHIRKLALTTADRERVNNISKNLAMPLDKTLDILRDKNGNIDLELPIKGQLDDPKVELADVFNKAAAKALKFTAMSYIKTALFPWGTVLAVASAVGEQAAKLQLQPVEFVAGQSAISAQMEEYLGKLIQMLKDKPHMNLTLCGIATLNDGKALQAKAEALSKNRVRDGGEAAAQPGPGLERPLPADSKDVQKLTRAAMLELADARSRAVQDYFVASGIEVGRALLCRSTINEDEDAKPAVDISF